jgi:hypothetical protein
VLVVYRGLGISHLVGTIIVLSEVSECRGKDHYNVACPADLRDERPKLGGTSIGYFAPDPEWPFIIPIRKISIVADSSFDLSVPVVERYPSIRASTCSVCAFIPTEAPGAVVPAM